MYGIYELSEDVVQVVLPPHEELPLPWGYPQSVYVLRGEYPALIDTGYRGAGSALLDALRSLEIMPARIHRVLLTGLTPASTGNLGLFPRAIPVVTRSLSDDPIPEVELEEERVRSMLEELLVEPKAPPSWDETVWGNPLMSMFKETSEMGESLLCLEDGDAVAAGNFVFDTLSVGGAYGTSTVYYAADKRLLFSGTVANVRPRPMLRDPTLLLDSLEKIESLSVAKLCPSRGPVRRDVHTQFRSSHLYVTNFRTNLQYLLKEPVSAGELAAGDLGYWPEGLVRFSSLALHFRQLLEEHVRAGVSLREEKEGRILYRMGTEQGRHRFM